MSKSKHSIGAAPQGASRILIVHGPNLNLLGTREPSIYGTETFSSLNKRLSAFAERHGAAMEVFQSNHEGALIERVHAAKEQGIDWIIINPGGLTHTSVALRDALAAVQIPFIEVHVSNIYSREPFRRHSYFSDLAAGTISGLGTQGYEIALQFTLGVGGKRGKSS